MTVPPVCPRENNETRAHVFLKIEAFLTASCLSHKKEKKVGSFSALKLTKKRISTFSDVFRTRRGVREEAKAGKEPANGRELDQLLIEVSGR